MQTIHINVDENKLDVLLNIIKNLKEDVVESYTISSNTADAFYDERKKMLTGGDDEVVAVEEPMYNFDTSMDALMEEPKV